jgi:catechol 2,3-dioxygenase
MSTADAQTTTPASAVLPAATRLGPVELIVTDLDRAVAFYQDVIGLRPHRLEPPVAVLGVGGEDLLVLTENPGARPAGRHAGLYHVAILYPSRVELARAALRIASTRTPIQGASDHHTHEAIYLSDPDGNGLELAADRPREQWPGRELYVSGPDPLDTNALFALVDGEEPRRPAAEGVAVGHVHLHVSDVDEALRFYRDALGFELQAQMPTAAFVSAGGYHHHVAFNVWRGEHIPPVDPDALGMRWFTVVVPDDGALEAVAARLRAAGVAFERDVDGDGDGTLSVQDPSGNALRIRTI